MTAVAGTNFDTAAPANPRPLLVLHVLHCIRRELWSQNQANRIRAKLCTFGWDQKDSPILCVTYAGRSQQQRMLS
jgi:hypothetical protein